MRLIYLVLQPAMSRHYSWEAHSVPSLSGVTPPHCRLYNSIIKERNRLIITAKLYKKILSHSVSSLLSICFPCMWIGFAIPVFPMHVFRQAGLLIRFQLYFGDLLSHLHVEFLIRLLFFFFIMPLVERLLEIIF